MESVLLEPYLEVFVVHSLARIEGAHGVDVHHSAKRVVGHTGQGRQKVASRR
jgi:hypothetical protein